MPRAKKQPVIHPGKTKEIVIVPATVQVDAGKEPELIPAVVMHVPLIDMALTDADIAPIRERAAAYERAADKALRKHSMSEINDPEIGEPRTVIQIARFDMSSAFNNLALDKARAAKLSHIQNLRKTQRGWEFEAYLDPRTV